MSQVLRGTRAASIFCVLFTIGVMALPTAPAIAGCQSGDNQNNTTTFNLDHISCNSRADGDEALAVGELAWALGARATSVGSHTAINSGTVEGATSIGARSNVTSAGIYSTAIGAGKTTVGPNSSGNYSVAIGGGDGAPFTPAGSTQINLNGAKASGVLSVAVGSASQATGGGGSALGVGSKASGDDSLALGDFSNAAGAGGIAGGLFSSASANGSVAIGRKAQATRPGAIALGDNSLANIANTLSVGTAASPRRIVNVSPAVGPKDAVNLAQVKALIANSAASNVSAEDTNRILHELRELVQHQQERITRLESRLASARQQ